MVRKPPARFKHFLELLGVHTIHETCRESTKPLVPRPQAGIMDQWQLGEPRGAARLGNSLRESPARPPGSARLLNADTPVVVLGQRRYSPEKGGAVLQARLGIQRTLVPLALGLLACGVSAHAQNAGAPVARPAGGDVLQDQVWFTPNIGSADMLDLFSSPEQWASARSEVQVFKFYLTQVGSEGWSCTVNPTANCDMNHLQNLMDRQAFTKLGAWGIGIAIESFFAGPIASVDPIVCSTSEHVQSLTLNGSVNAISNVQQNGGVVRYLAMDEPIRQWYPTQYYIVTGQTDPRPCLTQSLDSLADDVAAYILTMQALAPSISIGQVELYPEVGVAQFQEWILALEARGVSLPFLHIDVHGPRVAQYISFGMDVDVAADLATLKSFCEAHGIALGVIVTDITWNSQLWEEGEYDDGTYCSSTMDWVHELRATGVELDHWVFQSWVVPYYTTGPGPNQIPTNLPDDAPHGATHTRLIASAVPILRGEAAIPTISNWGVVAMAVLVLTAGTLVYARRQRRGMRACRLRVAASETRTILRPGDASPTRPSSRSQTKRR